jgi:hypothetical protein
MSAMPLTTSLTPSLTPARSLFPVPAGHPAARAQRIAAQVEAERTWRRQALATERHDLCLVGQRPVALPVPAANAPSALRSRGFCTLAEAAQYLHDTPDAIRRKALRRGMRLLYLGALPNGGHRIRVADVAALHLDMAPDSLSPA